MASIEGLYCTFTPLSASHGRKTYTSRGRRDAAFLAQKAWAEIGFAPPVIQRYGRYCYHTVLADPLVPFDVYNDWANGSDSADCDELDGEYMIRARWEAEGRPVPKGCKFDPFDDAHDGNIGWYKGRLVFLDFSL